MWDRDTANFVKVSEAPVNMIFTLIKFFKNIYLAALRLWHGMQIFDASCGTFYCGA